MKEADTVEVTGVLAESAKAPNGIEIRLGELKILSEPAEPSAASDCKVEAEHISGSKIKLQTDFSEKYQRACEVQNSGRNRKRVP